MKRRIFAGGLRDSNGKTPPENSDMAMFDFRDKGDEDYDGSIEEIHIYKPNNIVVADAEWLRKNWSKMEEWINNGKGSYMEDCQFFKENLK